MLASTRSNAGRRVWDSFHHRRLSSPFIRRFATGSEDGKFKVSGHTLFFTVLMVPVIGVSLYAGRYGPDEEQLEERIRERYQPDITATHNRNQAMAEFFQKAIKNPDGGAEDSRLEQVLHGGKGEKKRFHAVDKELYGTTAGIEEKLRTEEVLKQTAEEKKQRRKRRRKGLRVDEKTPEPVQEKEPEGAIKTSPTTGFQLPQGTIQVLAIVAVGAAAAIVGFIAGGQRK